MRILLIEPYYTGSHAAWVDGIMKYSRHDVSLLKLPGRYWKWRMHGGSVTLAKRFSSLGLSPDLIIVTDMLDLSSFLALTRAETHSIPIVTYFHENQLTYPWSPTDRDIVNKRDMHYAFLNYMSALVSDQVFFNSRFHMESFVDALPNFLKHFPDYNEMSTVNSIKEKSRVLPLGIELSRFDRYRSTQGEFNPLTLPYGRDERPLILWNHRWEYDKNPGLFFRALYELSSKGLEFSVVVLGERFGKIPRDFEEAKERLGPKIVKFGYADSFEELAYWLWRSDILPVTSIQDFFGISVMEALYCGCVPCLPKRLTYPELVPAHDFEEYFYDDDSEYISTLERILLDHGSIDTTPFRKIAAGYDWNILIDTYDRVFEEILK